MRRGDDEDGRCSDRRLPARLARPTMGCGRPRRHSGPGVRRILELASHANVKGNYDGGNFAFCKEDPLAAYEVLRKWGGYRHWKDVVFVDGQPKYCALGDGITDWAPGGPRPAAERLSGLLGDGVRRACGY